MIQCLDPELNSEAYFPRHILDQPHAIIITPSPETMVNWKVFADKTRLLFNSKKFTDAGIEVEAGLEKYPNQAHLLTLASDVYRAWGDYEKSLYYAELLITHNPEKWNGYGRAIKVLIALKRFEEAQEKIKLGLDKFPNRVNPLTIASDVYHASKDHKKSLEYAELLITHHEEKWIGYGRAAQDLIVLKRFEEAQEKIKLGLEKCPNQFNLLTIGSDIYHSSNDHKKSLEYAELLITHHEEKWIGYGRAAQDLIVLKRFGEAQEKIKLGLEKFPNQVKILAIASNVYRASNDHEKSLEYAELLITHRPEKWNRYVRVAEDLIALKRFKDLEIFCTKIEDKPIQKDLEVTNDWLFTSIAGQSALKDLDDDCMYAKMRDFSEGRNIFIPVGDFCCGAQFVSDSGGRQYALPFDWLFVNPNQVQTIIENNFSDFVDFKNLESRYPRRQCGHALYKNGNFFHHHDPSREPDRSAFIRRIERFKKLISVNTSDILFFNVRLSEKSDDLLDLLTVLPKNSKILSFVFLGNGSHEKPIVKHLDRRVLQIVFRCDNQNTLFAKNSLHPSGFTDGIYVYCSYSRAYARSLLDYILF